MKVMLLFPPNWTPTMPHLALPTLTAYLRSHGVEVIQRDLNQEVFDEVLTRWYLEQAIAHLHEDYGPNASRRPAGSTAPPREAIRWALTDGPQLANQVERAKAVIRSDAFFDGPIGQQALQAITQSLEIASLPF